MYNGLISLMGGPKDWTLWARQWTFCFHKGTQFFLSLSDFSFSCNTLLHGVCQSVVLRYIQAYETPEVGEGANHGDEMYVQS